MMKKNNIRIFLFFFVIYGLSFTGICATETDTLTPAPTTGEVQTIEGTFKDNITIGALDKVTGRTTEVTFKVGELIKIGTLAVKALRAWSSNPEETPEAKVFFEIVEMQHPSKTNNHTNTHTLPPSPHTIFKGWMLASSPSASSLEHPVYNIWVISVDGPTLDAPTKPVTEEKSLELDPKTSQTIDELIDHLTDSGDLPKKDTPPEISPDTSDDMADDPQ